MEISEHGFHYETSSFLFSTNALILITKTWLFLTPCNEPSSAYHTAAHFISIVKLS